ncbi:F-box protein At1g60400 [Linum grandiflorum]
MPVKEQRRSISVIAGGSESELISALPDEIIYEILGRLRSPEQTAQAAVLSRRWADIWRSYPTLEFYLSNEPLDLVGNRLEKRAAALLKKFSQQSCRMEAVRIAITSDNFWQLKDYIKAFGAFVNGVLDLAAKNSNSPSEIEIHFPIIIQASLLLPPSRLTDLKLQRCGIANGKFMLGSGNPFASFCSPLKQLCLKRVKFSDAWFANSLVGASSLLENLSLVVVARLERIELTNHTKLKTLEVVCCSSLIKIIGAHSLEIFRLTDYNITKRAYLHVSSTPNVKVLVLKDVLNLTDEKLNKLISEFPSLETLVLDKLWPPPTMIKIDAPKLTKFVYHAYADCFPTMLFNGCKETTFTLSFSFNNGFHDLKHFLVKSSEFLPRTHVHFTDPVERDRNFIRPKLVGARIQAERGPLAYGFEGNWNLSRQMQIPWDQATDEQPVPTVECVRFRSSYVREKENFMDILFWVCHPKSVCALKDKDSSDDYLLSLEYMCKQFMERGSNNNCKLPVCQCWRHQLKDAKIASRTGNNKPVNISSVIISSLGNEEEIGFDLDWN